MNRRSFVKALASIPLLGLLVKVPEKEEEFHLVMPGDPDYIDVGIGYAENDGEGSLALGNSALFEAAYAELQAGAEEQPRLELQVESFPRQWKVALDGVDISECVTSFEITVSTGLNLEYSGPHRGPWI